VLDTQPDLKALKVWCGRTTNTVDFTYFALVMNLKTNLTELRSIG